MLGDGHGAFLAPVAYPVGRAPSSVAVADFNGDGKLDLAVAKSYLGTVSILLGNGDGTFRPALQYLAAEAGVVVAGDLNGDGAPDLILASPIGGDVLVLLNNGDGTFQSPVRYSVHGAVGVVLGDFNGDGKIDLVVPERGSRRGGDVSILLGNGDGTFQLPVRYSVPYQPASLAVGDFNGDHKLDAAIAAADSTGASQVLILLGNGDGTLQPAVVQAIGGYSPESMVAADFNGDGKADLAVGSRVSNSLSVLLTNTSGTFDPPINYPAASAYSLAVADFNGDGKLDLAAVSATLAGHGINYSGEVTVLFGNGRGAFQRPPSYAVGDFPFSVAAGDFNGDGKLDLAVANETAHGTVSILSGNGDGTFQPQVTYPAGAYPVSLVVADFNGDGKIDLAVANFDSSNTVSVLLGNGDGTLQPPLATVLSAEPSSIATGDFNRDGKPDLAVTAGGHLVILLGNGAGAFQPPVYYPLPVYASGVAVGDFNGDGYQDLAVSAGGTQVLLGIGDGTFRMGVTLTGVFSVVIADFNGDSKLDLAGLSSLSEHIAIVLGNGDGTFRPPINYPAGYQPSALAVADSNGDGTPDLAVANNFAVAILPGVGDGTLQPAVGFDGGCAPVGLAAGPFGPDPKADLAVLNAPLSGPSPVCNRVAVLRNTTR